MKYTVTQLMTISEVLRSIFDKLIFRQLRPREIAFKKFSDNKMIVKYLEQGQ